MRVTHCDVCKKELEFVDILRVVYKNGILGHELCAKCAAPVIKFLKAKRLLKEEKKLA